MYGIYRKNRLARIIPETSHVQPYSTPGFDPPRPLLALTRHPNPNYAYVLTGGDVNGYGGVYELNLITGKAEDSVFEFYWYLSHVVDIAYHAEEHKLYAITDDRLSLYWWKSGDYWWSGAPKSVPISGLPPRTGLAGIDFSRNGLLIGVTNSSTNASLYQINRMGGSWQRQASLHFRAQNSSPGRNTEMCTI